MLFCRAVVAFSGKARTFAAGIIGRYRISIRSCWRTPNPGPHALLVLAYLRKAETFADLATERANAQLEIWPILRKLRCCPWRAGQLAKAVHTLEIQAA
jgi:hypothetical protein